jgi:hypothetical protein
MSFFEACKNTYKKLKQKSRLKLKNIKIKIDNHKNLYKTIKKVIIKAIEKVRKL